MPKLTTRELADIEATIATTEADQETKRREREEKRLAKEKQSKRQAQEKWVAPILLLLTIFISAILFFFNSK